MDPSGHICDKKYNELKSKDPSQLTDLERAQIAEYEAMKAQGMSPENSKGGKYSSLRDLMTLEEIARYDEHWLDVAEQISNEALDNQIQFIKNGCITKPGGGAYKPAKISATVDLNTGEIYIGYNGTNKFNPSRVEIHPLLQKRINNTMYLAENTNGNPYASRSSFQLWSVDNCAEVYSSNLALHNGASLDNILINTKEFISGKWAPPCENCKVTFEGVYFPKKDSSI